MIVNSLWNFIRQYILRGINMYKAGLKKYIPLMEQDIKNLKAVVFI